jgi:hypothetical protein
MHKKARRTLAVAAALLVGAAAACTDITAPPKSTVTGANIFSDPNSYKEFLAKLYVGLTATGQSGPAGNGDIQGIDEGFSQYVRLLWQMEELPTDEAVIAWNDAGVQELNTQKWGSSNQFLGAMYGRVFYQVSLANEFLRQTTDEKLASRGVSDGLAAQVKQYRAEARFLRALSYWHGIDLFGDIPLVKETDALGTTAPKQSTRAEIYRFIVQDLADLKGDLPAPGKAEYGRADQGAVLMLLGKLYLNGQVYAGENHYADARTAMEQLIASGAYSLDPSYRHLFQADNNTSPEMIFPVPQDGVHTQSYGGTTFLIHASVGGSMDPAKIGIDGGWYGLRAKPESYNLFAGDPRGGYFYTNGQSVSVDDLLDFNKGVGVNKYTNVRSNGTSGSNSAFPDTDYPMFRLGDAYLMYAEAVLRGGGGSAAQALTYVNALRTRAFGGTGSNITAGQLTLDFIKDERARELFWEGHRRTDLVRFGTFTDKGVWQWKGNVKAGQLTDPSRNLYPLPATELLANPNLKQNAGY